MKKCNTLINCCLLAVLNVGYVLCDEKFASGSLDQQSIENSNFVDGFLNVKFCHDRDNDRAFGPKNSSYVAFTPVLQVNDFIIESDFSYGRSFKYYRAMTGFRNLTRYVSSTSAFAKAYDADSKILSGVRRGASNGLDRPHFYRNYTRAIYNDESDNLRVMIGDTSTRSTIGFQQPMSGLGISIFRQSGDGHVISPGMPIVITKVTKAEIRLNGEILAVQILAPGTYTINDFCEEAKIPGAVVKIGDQLSRSEKLTINYFGAYDTPELGHDDFNISVIGIHKYAIDDPNKVDYESKPRFSGNYRRTYAEGQTFSIGAQGYENAYTLDAGLIFNTSYGKIATNVGYSSACKHHPNNALAASIYYSLPQNDYGISFETLLSVMAKGYSDLGITKDRQLDYNEFIDRYFTSADLKKQLLNSDTDASKRRIVCRLFSKPIWKIVPSFIFTGEWTSNKQRLREYTIALSTRLWNCCNLTVSAGITYDDPDKGVNQKSPDRRLTAACSVDVGSEVVVQGTYGHYQDDMRRHYASVTYSPAAIKGLELCAEWTRKPGLSNPIFSVKYENEYFNVKFEQSTTCSYKDAGSKIGADGHRNTQRLLLGTSLTKDGFKDHQKTNINIIRFLKK